MDSWIISIKPDGGTRGERDRVLGCPGPVFKGPGRAAFTGAGGTPDVVAVRGGVLGTLRSEGGDGGFDSSVIFDVGSEVVKDDIPFRRTLLDGGEEVVKVTAGTLFRWISQSNRLVSWAASLILRDIRKSLLMCSLARFKVTVRASE